MKLSVHIKGDVIAVPCGKGTEHVKAIGELSLKRYAKLKTGGKPLTDQIVEIRKTNGGAILDQDDVIKDVLDDNDFITIGELQFHIFHQNFVCSAKTEFQLLGHFRKI